MAHSREVTDARLAKIPPELRAAVESKEATDLPHADVAGIRDNSALLTSKEIAPLPKLFRSAYHGLMELDAEGHDAAPGNDAVSLANATREFTLASDDLVAAAGAFRGVADAVCHYTSAAHVAALDARNGGRDLGKHVRALLLRAEDLGIVVPVYDRLHAELTERRDRYTTTRWVAYRELVRTVTGEEPHDY